MAEQSVKESIIINPYYNHTSGVPQAITRGVSGNVRAEFDLIQAGFELVADVSTWQYGVAPEAHGAVGDGVTDDTAAFVAALATGNTVLGKAGKNYKITSGLTIAAANQFIAGNFTLTPVGNFDVITLTGGSNCGVDGPTVNATVMTGGYVINNTSADRVQIKNLQIYSPYNLAYVSRFNAVTFSDIWCNDIRGPYGFNVVGTPALRGDVLAIRNVAISASAAVAYASRMTGLTVDGNVQTIQIQGFGAVAASRGIHIKASTGTYPSTTPAFIQADDVEIDYPYYEGIKIDTCLSFNFVNVYACNSVTTNGVYVSGGSNATAGNFKGGIIRSNAKEGFVTGGTDISVSDAYIAFNSIGSGDLGKYAGVSVLGAAVRTSFSNVHSGIEAGSVQIQKYGIEVLAGALNTSWAGGSLKGNLLAPWSDSSGIANNNFNVFGASGSGLSVVNNVLTGTDSGFGARAHPTVAAGVITAVTVDAGGQHYDSAPTVYAFDPLGTGGSATFSVTRVNGIVTAIGVSSGGAGYSAGTILYIVPAQTSVTSYPYYPGTSNIVYRTKAKGSSFVSLGNDYSEGFYVAGVVNGVNQLVAQASATGATPLIYAAGLDADIHITFQAKGTGRVRAYNALSTTGKIYPGSDAGAEQILCGLMASNAAPNNANGANGDLFFNSSGGALTTIYQKRGGVWVGIV